MPHTLNLFQSHMMHIHAQVFQSWMTLPNGTFEAGKLSHIGQFFFDNDVNLQVNNMSPTNIFSPYLTMCPLLRIDISRHKGHDEYGSNECIFMTDM